MSISQRVKRAITAHQAAAAAVGRVRKSLLEEAEKVDVETELAEMFIEAILLAKGNGCTVKLVDSPWSGGRFLKEGPHLKNSAQPLELSFDQFIGFGKVEGLTGSGHSQLVALLEMLQSHGFIVKSVIVSDEENRITERMWNQVITFTLIW